MPRLKQTRERNLEKIDIHVAIHDGIRLSPYCNSSTKIKFECKRGHQFEMSQASIFRGYWCQSCRFDDYQEIVGILQQVIHDRGAKLMRPFESYWAVLIIKCSNGHLFRITPKRLKHGEWCPECPPIILK